jgi:hypothetical protein
VEGWRPDRIWPWALCAPTQPPRSLERRPQHHWQLHRRPLHIPSARRSCTPRTRRRCTPGKGTGLQVRGSTLVKFAAAARAQRGTTLCGCACIFSPPASAPPPVPAAPPAWTAPAAAEQSQRLMLVTERRLWLALAALTSSRNAVHHLAAPVVGGLKPRARLPVARDVSRRAGEDQRQTQGRTALEYMPRRLRVQRIQAIFLDLSTSDLPGRRLLLCRRFDLHLPRRLRVPSAQASRVEEPRT